MLTTTNEDTGITRFPEAPGRVDYRCFEFVVSGFEFVSDFGFRISSFGYLVAPGKTAST